MSRSCGSDASPFFGKLINYAAPFLWASQETSAETTCQLLRRREAVRKQRPTASSPLFLPAHRHSLARPGIRRSRADQRRGGGSSVYRGSSEAHSEGERVWPATFQDRLHRLGPERPSVPQSTEVEGSCRTAEWCRAVWEVIAKKTKRQTRAGNIAARSHLEKRACPMLVSHDRTLLTTERVARMTSSGPEPGKPSAGDAISQGEREGQGRARGRQSRDISRTTRVWSLAALWRLPSFLIHHLSKTLP